MYFCLPTEGDTQVPNQTNQSGRVSRGELAPLGLVIPLGALATFVAWGRYKRAPITPRTRRDPAFPQYA
jgi:hypothetical protein